jgi:hypothetical protein
MLVVPDLAKIRKVAYHVRGLCATVREKVEFGGTGTDIPEESFRTKNADSGLTVKKDPMWGDDVIAFVHLCEHDAVVNVGFWFCRGVTYLEEADASDCGGGAAAGKMALGIAAVAGGASVGNAIRSWYGGGLEEGKSSRVGVLWCVTGSAGCLFSEVGGNHAVCSTEVFWVLGGATAVLVLEADPEITIFSAVDGPQVHHGKGVVA